MCGNCRTHLIEALVRAAPEANLAGRHLEGACMGRHVGDELTVSAMTTHHAGCSRSGPDAGCVLPGQ